MPGKEIIPLETFCNYYHVELNFMETLEAYDLISVHYIENQRFILKEEIIELEKYIRMYYDLNINIPGIDALRNMLVKIKNLQQENDSLRVRLCIYE